jgi:ubiquinone/menaquinone biosynthesis C-methylase UbiE
MLFKDKTYFQYQSCRKLHWDKTSDLMKQKKGLGGYYHRRLEEVYCHLIPPGHSVLEIGCGNGNLLKAVNPSFGVGIDFSPNMLLEAKKAHPDLHFVLTDALESVLHNKPFDFIILSDLLNDVWDIQTVFENITALCAPKTRIIINTYSRLWEVPLNIVEKLGLARPVLYQNWLTVNDISGILALENFEIIRNWQEVIFPLNIPIVTNFLNRFLVKVPPFNHLSLTNFLLVRSTKTIREQIKKPSVSIVIPTRNEEGNIKRIFDSLPSFGCETEFIFVEGHSRDKTYETIQQEIELHPEIKCKLMQQSGVGKGDAVRLGFDHAEGDILMILDADLTVPPNYLIRFYDAIVSGKGEFINGVRLVYPMEKQAMQFLNLLGNKFFSLAFSWLLGQPVKDTLCGTKVLWRKDYQKIAENRIYFGDFDPFGDFDLLFGAAKLGLKIVDLPIRYRDRTYGTTNIQRWKHGLLLLQMAIFAARRLKFI